MTLRLNTLLHFVPESTNEILGDMKSCISPCNAYLSVLTISYLSVVTNFAPERANLHLSLLVTKLLQIVVQCCT